MGRPQEGEFCKRDVPKEAYKRCEMDGGKLVVRNDEQGCISFTKCVRRGDSRELEYEFIDEVPPATKLVEIAFKLEDIKINFDKLSRKSDAIASYYFSVGDDINAKKFETVAGMFESAKGKIDEIGMGLRVRVRNLNPEDIMNFKHDLKYISDVIMEDIAFVMLGGVEAMPRGYGEPFEKGDCGEDDFRCFEEALRICSPFEISPEPYMALEITGLEGKNCMIIVTRNLPEEEELSMKCAYPDYAFGEISKDNLLPFCEGDLVVDLKMEMDKEEPRSPFIERVPMEYKRQPMMPRREGEGMMGCDRVEMGIIERDVCGNDCCEPNIGEEYENCPDDCMSPGERDYEPEPQGFREKGTNVKGIEGGIF